MLLYFFNHFKGDDFEGLLNCVKTMVAITESIVLGEFEDEMKSCAT